MFYHPDHAYLSRGHREHNGTTALLMRRRSTNNEKRGI